MLEYHLNESIDASSRNKGFIERSVKWIASHFKVDKYTIIKETRTQTVYNWLQYFSPESLRKEFKENGFNIGERYSDVAGKAFTSESTEIAIVAKKYGL